MSPRDSSGGGFAWTRRRALIAGSAAVILAAGTAAVIVAGPAGHPAARHHAVASGAIGSKSARLAASTCSGPAGAAYVADAVYVTNTIAGAVEVISAATHRVTGTITVGQMPWQLVLSPRGGTLYVADADSNEISVITTSSGRVTSTIPLSGDPDTLALTPDGSQLWVGGLTSAIVTVLDTANHSVVGEVNLGGDGANSGDGYEPTGMVLTATPTPSAG